MGRWREMTGTQAEPAHDQEGGANEYMEPMEPCRQIEDRRIDAVAEAELMVHQVIIFIALEA